MKKRRKSKILELIIYSFSFTILIAISVFLILEYSQLSRKKQQIEKQAQTYQILNEDKISFLEEQEKLEQLEKELLEKYQSSNVDDIRKKIISKKVQNEQLQEAIFELEKSVDELNSKNDELKNQYHYLKRKREEEEGLAKEAASIYQINGVIAFNQQSRYPTGCESVSLHILLSYYGVSPGVDTIIDYLPQGGWLYNKDGVTYGGNPELEFIGSPYDIQSFGVYEGPMIQVANIFKDGIINGRGQSLDEVLAIVGQGRPVMVWTTIGLLQPYVSASWIYEATMEQINWYAHEHVVVMIGFSDSYVIISDPYDGNIKKQSRSLFESRYDALGRRNLYY